jgi:flagellar hook-associated protein 2
MPITSSGVGSGIDINSIVSQLMAVESRPLTRLQSKTSELQSSISAFGKLTGAISTFQDAARQLSSAERWQTFKASSTNESAISANTSASASAAEYAVSVSRLAKANTLVSAEFASASTIVGTGQLVVSLGSLDPNTQAFSLAPGKTAVSVNVGDGSLTSIRDAINNSAAGVTASIVNTGTGSRLVMTSKETGANNAIQITVTDTDGQNSDQTGLSRLAYQADQTAGSGRNLELQQAAQDARLSINGIDITSSTNQVSTAIDGVSFTLKAETVTPVTVSVVRDTAASLKSAQSFVSAYNDLQKLLRDQTNYIEGAKTQPVLQGDSTALGVLQRLRATITGSYSGLPGDFQRLSDVGISVQRDGSLSLSEARWNSANENVSKVSRLFADSGSSAQPNTIGFAKRLDTLAGEWLGTNGSLTTKTEGLNRSVKRNQKSQDDLQNRLELTQKRLFAQYQAMDSRVAALQSQSASLTQQLAALQSRNNNN